MCWQPPLQDPLCSFPGAAAGCTTRDLEGIATAQTLGADRRNLAFLVVLLTFPPGDIIFKSYHRMVRVGRDLKDHLIPTPLP